MSILTITDLSHRYEDEPLFDNVSLEINNFEKAGIVGLNGAGKTTFMNILTGRTLQDTGLVRWLKGIRIGYLDQHADIDRSLTVMEYLKTAFEDLFVLNEKMERLYSDMGGEKDAEKLDAMVRSADTILQRLTLAGFFDIEPTVKKIAGGLGVQHFGYDSLISTLSGGQRAKLMLAKLLLENLDVMLLDEPTNFLDTEHIEWLKSFLKSFEGTVLLISHDTAFLNSVCNFIVSVENRTIKKYSGNYDQFKAQHDSNLEQYAANYERQQEHIKKLETYIAKNKARAATAGMANSRQKQLDKIVELKKPLTAQKPEFSFPYIFFSGREILTVKDLLIGYEGRPLLPEINFTVNGDTKLWIRGTNGIGKTTLIKTITSRLPAVGGEFTWNINAKYNYIEQDLIFKSVELTPFDYIANLYPRLPKAQVRGMLAGTGLKADLAVRPIYSLSGGEQVRVKLCDIMNRPSNVLVLDEPTNHLDTLAKDALAEALKNYEGAVILVTHEPIFAKAFCNKVFDAEEFDKA